MTHSFSQLLFRVMWGRLAALRAIGNRGSDG